MATKAKARPVRQIPANIGPWKGVKDVGDAGEQNPAFLQDAINCWFQDPVNGGAVFARPGFQRTTGTALEGGSAIQALFGIQHSTGVFLVFAFVNGKLYRQASATTWTDVSPAGITISSTANQIHAIVYNGEMIVNDGVNEPWRGTSLTSGTITGTEIEINTAGSAWIARGRPTVHGGKLFFIVDDIGGTKYFNRIVWSEEASAATGYLQDGFTNSWDLIQSPVASERLLAIQGTNTGLYYFRNYAIGVIYGAVNDDFQTTSTHDGVSSDVGMFPAAIADVHDPGVLLAKNYIWFLDSSANPCRLRVGSTEIDKVWLQLRNRIARYTQTFPNTQLAYSADLDKVAILFLTDTGGGVFASYHVYLFDAATGSYEGRWMVEQTTQPTNDVGVHRVSALAAVQRSDDFSPAMATAGTSTFIFGTVGGHVFHQTSFQMYGASSVSLGDNAGTMHQSITTMLYPDEENTELNVDEVALEVVPDTTAVSLDYYTPYGSSTGLSATGKASSDSIQSSHDHGIARWGLGQNAFGRWFRAVFHKNVSAGTTKHAFEKASYKVRPVPASPFAP